MEEYYGNNDYRDYLMHYGVLGMRWGIRRYQPYSVRGRKSGKGGKEIGEARRSHNNKASKINKPGYILETYAATFALTVAASIIASAVDRGLANRFKKKCDAERDAAKEVDKKTGLKKQVELKSKKEDLKRVNPRRNTTSYDYSTKSNCVNCSYAYEARRRGYEVQARLSSTGKDVEKVTPKMFKNAKLVKSHGYAEMRGKRETLDEWTMEYAEKAAKGANKSHAKTVMDDLKSQPTGARGQLIVNWSNWGGHALNYEILENGKLELLDGQTNTIYNEKQAENLLRHTMAAGYYRLDNKAITKSLGKECVK